MAARIESGIRALGVDIEEAVPLDEAVVDLVVRDDEVAQLGDDRRFPPGLGGKILFSAKEAIYKASFFLTGQSLDLLDVRVRFETGSEAFVGRVGPQAQDLSGRYHVDGGYVVTGVTVHDE